MISIIKAFPRANPSNSMTCRLHQFTTTVQINRPDARCSVLHRRSFQPCARSRIISVDAQFPFMKMHSKMLGALCGSAIVAGGFVRAAAQELPASKEIHRPPAPYAREASASSNPALVNEEQ